MSDTIVVVLGLCAVTCGSTAVFVWVRNNRVHEYRMRLLHAAQLAGGHDIDAGRSWKWRFDAFNRWTHNQMMWRFWRRCSSFYPSLDFIDPAFHPDTRMPPRERVDG